MRSRELLFRCAIEENEKGCEVEISTLLLLSMVDHADDAKPADVVASFLITAGRHSARVMCQTLAA